MRADIKIIDKKEVVNSFHFSIVVNPSKIEVTLLIAKYYYDIE